LKKVNYDSYTQSNTYILSKHLKQEELESGLRKNLSWHRIDKFLTINLIDKNEKYKKKDKKQAYKSASKIITAFYDDFYYFKKEFLLNLPLELV